MTEVRWELYPLVAQCETARAWLKMQGDLQLAPKTIDAYGRSLNDYLTFCSKHGLVPETVMREHIALYVQDLATRPNPKGGNVLHMEDVSPFGVWASRQILHIERNVLAHDRFGHKAMFGAKGQVIIKAASIRVNRFWSQL